MPVAERESSGHDIVVVGGSAGGVEALRTIVAKLPGDLPAAIFAVIHVPAIAKSVLPSILQRAGDLPARHAEDEELIDPGRIYVAPPDRHLLVRTGYVRVVRSAKENGYRPCIDSLFRSAATSYGPRVVGVVLSGVLADGTIGLATVKEQGGRTLAQSPDDALYPMMPRSAIDAVDPDRVLPAFQLAAAIVELVAERRRLDRGTVRRRRSPTKASSRSTASGETSLGSAYRPISRVRSAATRSRSETDR